MDEFSMYDNGWRMGVFDRCNGRERKLAKSYDMVIENEIWFAGYDDAYDSNERRI